MEVPYIFKRILPSIRCCLVICRAKSHTADMFETNVLNYSNSLCHGKEMVVSILVL
jgi:hypothetical protein